MSVAGRLHGGTPERATTGVRGVAAKDTTKAPQPINRTAGTARIASVFLDGTAVPHERSSKETTLAGCPKFPFCWE
jgi:hypothetical protein